ncbi:MULTISPECIES: outer membrane protein assembly factor BamA [unclassified Undibacterium]|uniref:outer membrane protein assembly factor BamA n=1 Tax=unclassified Undibacterium TaxID=2630295 RepID=UPI002AC899C9|nr:MULTISPECIES: outer membrane protein assembly factor BamA [unclassified Undibacterium]MEB0138540.1 outer membrane protein assembly factor BamA [Undibacterium sp. CCC2.1]MEB0171396.1 outer membrane protein assembly factor BamA [Undibacterium sp. CCC1.1]MEB0175304.1 outer membrane protein assembly factor BamA [Undibacterium sp. CCC3.4]MEB0214592.1 outer membrane protein assembly factor BamA [Undibacterium sp. 5I2]WPX43033.1 outer membrane protein assembly factor BamA [Undibacterium sp. CCC3.4
MKLHIEHFTLPNFRLKSIALAALALCTGSALAIPAFTVKDIRVEGLQRTEAGTVFSYLPVKVGETFDEAKSTAAIKSLYATGFFKDIQIEEQDGVLVVLLEERPTIAGVEFSGTKEFEKDALIKALKDIGIGESRIFDKATVDRAEQELKRQYLSKGLYGMQITTTITPIERNRVRVTFAVDEGDIARIAQINIIGNKAFSDSDLRATMALNTPTWFSWYTKADQYSKQKLAGDLETLRSFYQNRGYLEMQILSSQIAISADKKDIYITVNLVEGDKYNISDIKLEGEMFGRETELGSLLLLKKGDIYNAALLTESTKRISERMGNFGYAFANVNANPILNKEKKEVAFTVLVDPGKRVYVRHINLAGNTRTRDEVIRREFRQFEASWYDGEKIKASRDRVERLSFFNDVKLETPEVATSTDQVDINLTVTEKPTGNLMFGAGYSNAERLTLSGSISQANAFGSGDTIGLEVNTSSQNRTVALSHVDPYFTDDGISRSLEAYLRTTRPVIGSVGDYKIQTTGGNMRFGVPFSEVDTVFFGIGAERTKVSTTSYSSPQRYKQYVATYGSAVTDPTDPDFGIGTATTTSFPLTAAWQRDSRDSVLTPSVGRYQRANLEVAAIGNLKYYRAIYNAQYFKPVYRSVILALNGEFDYGHGLGGNPYPIFKNFYAGGIGSVRGYEPSSLGTRDPNNDSLGGAARIIGNIEFQIPFPGADKSLRWFTFLDGGQVFDEGQKIQVRDLRFGAGIGISWISPVGPLKLSFGRALNAKPEDKKQSFQFQMGTGF